MNFEDAFEKLIGHEGGYSNRSLSADPGGATNFGVTQAVARENGYAGDMRNFTIEQAKAIYRKSYWDACRCDDLPSAIRFSVFDGCVNSGVGQSIRWLQRAVGTEADGSIGPLTLAAVRFLPAMETKSRYNGFRLQFMTGLKNWPDNSRGWANRIAKNLMEA